MVNALHVFSEILGCILSVEDDIVAISMFVILVMTNTQAVVRIWYVRAEGSPEYSARPLLGAKIRTCRAQMKHSQQSACAWKHKQSECTQAAYVECHNFKKNCSFVNMQVHYGYTHT